MKVTGEPKEILVEFMRTHAELIFGKFSPSFSKKDGEALWKLLGETIIGPQKEWKAWRKVNFHIRYFRSVVPNLQNAADHRGKSMMCHGPPYEKYM
jgi:hypothetical protein